MGEASDLGNISPVTVLPGWLRAEWCREIALRAC